MQSNLINVSCLVIGFMLSAYSSTILYNSSHQVDNCIIGSLVETNSTVLDSNIKNHLANCGTIANSDFPYAILQILGLFIPVISIVTTTKLKEK